jgi:hypothetical protein
MKVGFFRRVYTTTRSDAWQRSRWANGIIHRAIRVPVGRFLRPLGECARFILTTIGFPSFSANNLKE